MSQNVVNPTHIASLKDSMQQAIDAGELVQFEAPLDHYMTSDLYARRVYVPAGATIVTKVHKSEHITVALKGHCVVVDEIGHRVDVVAPAVFVTKPGTQRAIYAITETEWLTVHSYQKSDKSLESIEKFLVCDTMQQYYTEDYSTMLEELNMSEETARAISEVQEDQIPMPEGETLTYIAPSEIEGQGVFARETIAAGGRIGPARIGAYRTPVGRYTNHSLNANAHFSLCDSGVDLVANADIQQGEEITVNYRDALQVAMQANAKILGSLQ